MTPEPDGTAHDRPALDGRVVLSVDVMGGDLGSGAVIAGVARAAGLHPGAFFLLHGPEQELQEHLSKTPAIARRCAVRHAERVIRMDEKPSFAMRNGKGTSMWSAIEAVRGGEATVAVSCGNTGALMALSMLRLRTLSGVARPAIAALWPAQNKAGFAVVLDVGADLRADAQDLVHFAIMGAAYARHALGEDRPRVGLLNVGTEAIKGRSDVQQADALLTAGKAGFDFDYVGFVEGDHIPEGGFDVIVTDGFSGNIALKTAEGTARLIRALTLEAFGHSILSRIAAYAARGSLRRLAKRIDPRQVNGGVFLGLTGTVVKSHGGADATGVAAALSLAHRLAESGFTDRLATLVASGDGEAQDKTG